MATRALDIITIMHALDILSEEIGANEWQTTNPQQRRMFEWYRSLRPTLAKVKNLKAKASRFYEELNKFLTDDGFDPMVEPFDPETGLGVVSILDMLVEWLHGPGELVEIQTAAGTKPGFEIPSNGVHVFELAGYPGLLVNPLTKGENSLWLYLTESRGFEGLDMVQHAMRIMSAPRGIAGGNDYPTYGAAHIPMIDFDIKPDIDWLQGAVAKTDAVPFRIDQAAQQFKLRMNEEGARVKVATVVVAEVFSMGGTSLTLIVDQPFYGWWTQKAVPTLPMAVFFADFESWKKPEGSLAEL